MSPPGISVESPYRLPMDGSVALARTLGPLVVAALGVCLVGFGGTITLGANAQVTPAATTQGEVLDVETERILVRTDDWDYRRGDQDTHYVHRVTARYRYEVDGETYVGERLGRPDPLTVEAGPAARTYASDLRTADGVTVYYDPANPGRSYLRATYPVWWLLAHTVGWALLLGLVAVDAYGVASWFRGLVDEVPVAGARTPLGTAAALPVYAGVWYLALVPWYWLLDRGDPGGFGLAPLGLVILLGLAWVALQANAWLRAWADAG